MLGDIPWPASKYTLFNVQDYHVKIFRHMSFESFWHFCWDGRCIGAIWHMFFQIDEICAPLSLNLTLMLRFFFLYTWFHRCRLAITWVSWTACLSKSWHLFWDHCFSQQDSAGSTKIPCWSPWGFPRLRWSKARSAAAQLEAEIWKFRTRVCASWLKTWNWQVPNCPTCT